jgi:hypothetical protein
MSRTLRNSAAFLLLFALVASLSLAALAASEGGETEEGATDEATTTTIESGLAPAVPVVTDEAEVPTADWTYRYMVPTGLALAAVIIVFTAVKYFTDVVRKRYRIVEE